MAQDIARTETVGGQSPDWKHSLTQQQKSLVMRIKNKAKAPELTMEEQTRAKALLSTFLSQMDKGTVADRVTVLMKLRLHFPDQALTTGQAKSQIEDMLKDLNQIPLGHLALACEKYRQDPDKIYFPNASVLFQLAQKSMTDNQEAIAGIQICINYRENPTATPDIRQAVVDEMKDWSGKQDRRRVLKALGNDRTHDQGEEYTALHKWANEDRKQWKQQREMAQ